MDVHEEAIDDLIGEGLVVIDGRNEKVSYWLTVSLEAGPVNLKPQQRDLTPVLRRPVEPAPSKRT
jgi:hypothetical protein